MGRELRRREEKHTKIKSSKDIKKIKNSDEQNNSLKQAIKVVVIIIILYLVAYLIVGIFVTKEINLDFFKKEEETTSTVSIDSSHILASQTFRLKDSEYYVYFNSYENTNTNIETIISNYLSDTKLYVVDTDSALNQAYISTEESGDKKVQKIDNLKVVAPTIIKITNEKNVLYLEGEEAIVNYFK